MKLSISASGGKKLIIANWKMNPETLPAALRLAAAYRPTALTALVVCPPTVFLPALIQRFGERMGFGAQDCYWASAGAYTGETSPKSLKVLGAEYVILGHSERRKYVSETDALIRRKVKACLAERLTPVLCLGGGLSAGASEARVKSVLRLQFRAGTKDVRQAEKLILVFEPAYAISTFAARRVGARDASVMVAFLRKLYGDRFGFRAAAKTRILYGGSVDETSFRAYLAPGQIDGFLVGGASLRPKAFNIVLKAR